MYLNDIWDTDDNILKLSTENRTRGHSQKLHKERWYSSIRGHVFSNRMVNLWNSLPEAVVKSKM